MPRACGCAARQEEVWRWTLGGDKGNEWMVERRRRGRKERLEMRVGR